MVGSLRGWLSASCARIGTCALVNLASKAPKTPRAHSSPQSVGPGLGLPLGKRKVRARNVRMFLRPTSQRVVNLVVGQSVRSISRQSRLDATWQPMSWLQISGARGQGHHWGKEQCRNRIAWFPYRTLQQLGSEDWKIYGGLRPDEKSG